MSAQVSKEDRLLAALSYPFWPLAFLIMNLSPVLRRQGFVRYHAFQAFFLGMGIWLGMIVLGSLADFLGRFLWPIGLLYHFVHKLLGLGAMLITAWSSFQAWKGNKHALPCRISEWTRFFAEEIPAPESSSPDASATRDLVERICEPPSAPRAGSERISDGEPRA